jgi:hypothetical protein
MMGEDVGKKEHIQTLGGKCKLVKPVWKAVWMFPVN